VTVVRVSPAWAHAGATAPASVGSATAGPLALAWERCFSGLGGEAEGAPAAPAWGRAGDGLLDMSLV